MYILILGLDHSRTTVTDIWLGEAIGAISLGEVRRTISPRGKELENRQLCTCGESFMKCTVWNRYTDGSLFEQADVCVIDSSKDIKHYKTTISSKNDFCTILVIRRFKNWFASITEARRRNNNEKFSSIFSDRYFFWANLRLYLRKFYVVAYLEWLITHLRFILAIEGQAYVITSSNDLLRIASKLRRNDERLHQRHIVRGNRISNSGAIILKEFDERGILPNIIKLYLERNNG